MLLTIPRDALQNPVPPTCYLCTQSGRRIGEIPAYATSLTAKWNSWSEFSLTFDRRYVDVLTGETKVNPLFDKAEGLRQVEVANIGHFIIQDPDTTYSDNESKTISCLSMEYACGSKYLENFYINNGAYDSKEVIYEQSKYGSDATKDQMYKPATPGGYDEHAKYFHRVYTDSRNYTYEQIQIADEDVYKTHFGNDVPAEDVLYVNGYANVQFYDPDTPELSLLHLVFEYIPEWKIGHVDYSLRHKERKFEEERVAIYDFLMNQVADTFKCVVEWDTQKKEVNFYEEADDGINDDGTVQSRYESDVYISRENIASEIHMKYSTDDIKTKLKVVGADGVDIREVNCGKNYIMNLDYYHNLDWMEQDLYEAYQKYLRALNGDPTSVYADKRKGYATLFSEAVQQRVSAYNGLDNLNNAVPAEGNAVLVGDEFKKLYCTYSPINTAYFAATIGTGTEYVEAGSLYLDEERTKQIPTPKKTDTYVVQGALLVYDAEQNKFKVDINWDAKKKALIQKLNQYHVDDDTEANKQDNILLKLKNSSGDVATIRIYDKRMVATEYNDKVKYYAKTEDEKWFDNPIKIDNGTQFDAAKDQHGDRLYTNDYCVQSVVIRTNGASEEPDQYTIIDWIKGMLTSEYMGLDDYKITYIGTMGAYFVLAKDETLTENLQDYGIRLLEEKHETYTKIFQTQTEAMLSQEKAQCIVQDDAPDGDYKTGTRWLDTNSKPVKLRQYNGSSWVEISASISDVDQSDYENYQRYIDNYNKLQAVQEVLVEKQKLAEYFGNGYKIEGVVVNTNDTDANVENLMSEAAQTHFGNSVSIIKKSFDISSPLYVFTPSSHIGKEFAIYLQGSTPYVAYLNSVGVAQAKMNYYSQQSELRQFFNDSQWSRLSPLIREDEFTDSNYLLTSYESEAERLEVYKELAEAASKELKTLSQPSIEFSMNMGNLLALPEFEPIMNQFSLGKFIRIDLGHGLIKKARLLEASLQFDDLSSFSATFGNLITTKSAVELHAELMSQAMQAGKTVAQAAGSWQMAVDKSNKLEEDIANGLQDATLEIGRAYGQSIEFGKYGLRGRKLIEGTTDQYEPEQVALINNKLVFTSDNWQTSKSVFGKYKVDGEEKWGVLAEHVTADTLVGKFIKGGRIQIGDETKEGGNLFIVNEDGTVEIKSGGTNYVEAMKDFDDIYRFRTELEYSGSTIFTAPGQSRVIKCRVFDFGQEITSFPPGTKFKWIRESNEDDAEWNQTHEYIDSNTITITNEDIQHNARFYCQCELDETKLP